MNIQDVILGFLMEGPLSGYDVKRKFEQSVQHFFDASYGAIYPALKKMEQQELIVKEVVPQEGKPNKNLFAITEKGRESFRDYLASPVAPTLTRSDFLIRVFFGSYSSKEQLQKWFLEQREKTQAALEQLLATREEVEQTRGENKDPFKMKTLEYGVRQYKMTLELLDQEIREMGGE